MVNSGSKIIFNIGKKLLKQIIEPISTTKVTYFTGSECTGESCNLGFYNSDNEDAKKYCASYCPKAHVVRPVIKRLINFNSFSGPIINPKGQFTRKSIKVNILATINQKKIRYKTNIRLSLNQIKQMLALYSLCDANGVLKSINKQQIANVVNCTEKTIANNNILLSKLGFITINPREKGDMSIIICNYREQYKPDCGGYLVMSKHMLSTLMEIKDVNALRIAIPAIINDDMNSLFNHATKFSIKDIKKLLPDYIYTRKAVAKIIETFNSLSKSVFKWKEDSDVFIVNIDKSFDGKTIKQESTPIFENEIIAAISEKYSATENVTVETIKENLSAEMIDLVAMSFEYGVDVVKTFSVQAFSIKETIRCFGAYVRQLICKFYEEGEINVA